MRPVAASQRPTGWQSCIAVLRHQHPYTLQRLFGLNLRRLALVVAVMGVRVETIVTPAVRSSA
jgi:hypothetical protein